MRFFGKCFSEKSRILPNFKKKENFKFNFKSFFENFQLNEMNIQNRKSQVNLKELKLLWEKYELKSNELNLMRRKLNELNAQTKKLAVSGEKLSNFILKDKSKHQSNIEERQKELEEIESNMIEEAFHIPNSTSPQSPVGIENKEIYSSTEETLEQLCKKFEKHIHHTDLIEKKDLCDFENGSKLSGSKFLFLKSKLVYLELGLVMYALEKLEKKGFTIVSSPEIVKNEIITGCGFTPRDKSKNQIYHKF